MSVLASSDDDNDAAQALASTAPRSGRSGRPGRSAKPSPSSSSDTGSLIFERASAAAALAAGRYPRLAHLSELVGGTAAHHHGDGRDASSRGAAVSCADVEHSLASRMGAHSPGRASTAGAGIWTGERLGTAEAVALVRGSLASALSKHRKAAPSVADKAQRAAVSERKGPLTEVSNRQLTPTTPSGEPQTTTGKRTPAQPASALASGSAYTSPRPQPPAASPPRSAPAATPVAASAASARAAAAAHPAPRSPAFARAPSATAANTNSVPSRPAAAAAAAAAYARGSGGRAAFSAAVSPSPARPPGKPRAGVNRQPVRKFTNADLLDTSSSSDSGSGSGSESEVEGLRKGTGFFAGGGSSSKESPPQKHRSWVVGVSPRSPELKGTPGGRSGASGLSPAPQPSPSESSPSLSSRSPAVPPSRTASPYTGIPPAPWTQQRAVAQPPHERHQQWLSPGRGRSPQTAPKVPATPSQWRPASAEAPAMPSAFKEAWKASLQQREEEERRRGAAQRQAEEEAETAQERLLAAAVAALQHRERGIEARTNCGHLAVVQRASLSCHAVLLALVQDT